MKIRKFDSSIFEKLFFFQLKVFATVYLLPASILAYEEVNTTPLKYIFLINEVLIFFYIVLYSLKVKNNIYRVLLVIIAIGALTAFLRNTSFSMIVDREMRAMLLALLFLPMLYNISEEKFNNFFRYLGILLTFSAILVFAKAFFGDPESAWLPTPGIGVKDYIEFQGTGLFRIYANTIALAMFMYIFVINKIFERTAVKRDYIYLLSSIVIILFYFSRVVFLICVLIIVMNLFRSNKKNWGLAITGILAAMLLLPVGDIVISRFTSIYQEFSEQRGSYLFRAIEYKAALNSIQDNPVFGVGLGSPYRGYLALANFETGYETPEVGFKMIHNGFLFLLTKGGIILFIGYLFIYIKNIRFLLGNKKTGNQALDLFTKTVLFYQLYFLIMNASADYFFQINHVLVNFSMIGASIYFISRQKTENLNVVTGNNCI